MAGARFLTVRYRATGTRFRVFPQQPKSPKAFRTPEIVYLNAAPGTIAAGPADEDIQVVDARNKPPYFDVKTFTDTEARPPWGGPRRRAARPRRGHFDHIRPRDPTFLAATAFATIRCTLMVWEHYLGRKVRWYFRDTYRRLEVIPRVELDNNAISRYGYLELGFRDLKNHAGPLARSFDVVAHEIGHTILRDVIGYSREPMPVEYRAHEEAAADLVAIVAALHFESVVNYLLSRTKGNLFTGNVLSRLGEMGSSPAFRHTINWDDMRTLIFDANPDRYKYELAKPFLGGAYALLVEMFQLYLVERGAIDARLARRSDQDAGTDANVDLTSEFAKAYRNHRAVFRSSLLDARDDFAYLLAATWTQVDMATLSFSRVVETMLDADRTLYRGRYGRIITKCFRWREIVPRRRGWRRP